MVKPYRREEALILPSENESTATLRERFPVADHSSALRRPDSTTFDGQAVPVTPLFTSGILALLPDGGPISMRTKGSCRAPHHYQNVNGQENLLVLRAFVFPSLLNKNNHRAASG